MEDDVQKEIEKEVKQVSINKWQIVSGVLGVLLVITLFMGNFGKDNSLTGSAVAEKTVSYINTNILKGQGVATVKSFEDVGDNYNLRLSINGQEFNTYVTKDGKLLFPQVVDLEAAPLEAQQQAPQNIPKTDKPVVRLYTMSYCPYGNQAEEAMKPVADLMGSKAEIEPHYVIYSNYQGGGPQYCLDKENKYCSMHGIQELNQDVRELCIYKYQKDKFWSFLMKVNTACNYQNVDACWEAVAKENGIDTEKIKTCQKDEAETLLANEVKLNQEDGAQGSPMLVINGVEYSGGRTPEAYKQAICSAFNTEPSECGTALSAAGTEAAGGCES